MAQGTCSIEGCETKVFARGFCGAHYTRWYRYGSPHGKATQPTVEQRFWAKVRKTDLCWMWTGCRNRWGYGAFYVGNKPDGRKHRAMAHRFAWERLVGPIPEGMEIDHLCRNPPCVNPGHLEVVTKQENALRGVNHTMPRTHCSRGHLLSADNLRRQGQGRVVCATCARERIRQWKERHGK